jgi:hypothetical protein
MPCRYVATFTLVALLTIAKPAAAYECRFADLPDADFRAVALNFAPSQYRAGGLMNPDHFMRLADGKPLIEKGILIRGVKAWIYEAEEKQGRTLEYWFAEKLEHVSVRVKGGDSQFFDATCRQ